MNSKKRGFGIPLVLYNGVHHMASLFYAYSHKSVLKKKTDFGTIIDKRMYHRKGL